MDKSLNQVIPLAVVAVGFNIYENLDGSVSIEMVGTRSFDPVDDDWLCDEVTTFGTREQPLKLAVTDNDHKEYLDEIYGSLVNYLDHGLYAKELKKTKELGVGFVDGDIQYLHQQK